MASSSDLDHYKTLGVEKSATSSEISSAYKKLALRWHPDKNQNSAESTATFQKIQSAYETLSDERKRTLYDFSLNIPSSGAAAYSEEQYDEDEYEIFTDPYGFRFGYGPRRDRSPNVKSPEAFFHTFQARQEAQNKARAYYAAKREEAKAKVAERAAKKEKEEKQARLAKEKLEREEKAQQEKIWQESGAKTAEEKQKTCRHSSYWPKELQQPKFKCGKCGKKRGMFEFKCPHCTLRVCQACLEIKRRW